MNRASTQSALRKVEEARNDRYERRGHEDYSMIYWVSKIAATFGTLAQDVDRYSDQAAFDRRELLHFITADAADLAAACLCIMEQCESAIGQLSGPRIREFEQVMIEDGV